MKHFTKFMETAEEMILSRKELRQKIKENPGKPIPVMDLSSIVYSHLIPKKRSRGYEANGLHWSLSSQGVLSVTNIAKCYAEIMDTPEISWKFHAYRKGHFVAHDGIYEDFCRKESSMNLIKNPWSSSDNRVYFDSDKDCTQILMSRECFVDGPSKIFFLEDHDTIRFSLDKTTLLDQYTGVNQNLYVAVRALERPYSWQNLLTNKTIMMNEPFICQYLAEKRGLSWALSSWEELKKKKISIGIINQAFVNTYSDKADFLQTNLEKYWNDIAEEMGIKSPHSAAIKFCYPVSKWELIGFAPYEFPPAMMSLFPKYQKQFQPDGKLTLYFPEFIKEHRNMSELMENFYHIFVKILLQKTDLYFGFRQAE